MADTIAESRQDQKSTLPKSLRDREYGSYRPTGHERDTALAVSDPSGLPIGAALLTAINNLTEEMRLLRLSLTITGVAEDLN